MAKMGEIAGVAVATNKGNEYLRSLPDDNENNNLGNLCKLKMISKKFASLERRVGETLHVANDFVRCLSHCQKKILIVV